MANEIGVNRSEAIRNFFKKNKNATTQEVIDGLAKQGITVTAGLVTTVKYKHIQRLAAKKTVAEPESVDTKPEVNKTQAVRIILGRIARRANKEVADALTAEGIAVDANYVAKIKSKSKTRRKAVKTVVASTGLDIAQIKAAFRFIKECGDTAAAKAALSAADELKKLVVV